ncbi:MAG: fatty acid desaturase [Rhodobacter sp.]|nr:fatty acid desaturase [Rhodobacter sp.]
MGSIRQMTRAYTTRDNRIAAVNTVLTLAVYMASLIGAILAFQAGRWYAGLPAMAVSAICGVRIYMLQHDCGHGSYFTTRKLNDFVGRLLSPFSLTPFNATRHNHNLHHAHIGDLDRRDSSEIYVMTLAEYRQASWHRRLGYRFYRSFFVLFLVGPTLLYVLQYRYPKNSREAGLADLWVHNAMVAAFLGALFWSFGWTGLLVWLGSVALAVSTGVLIPYVHHNFETVYWGRKPQLDFDTAAMEGSAVLDFGWFFDLCTANIAYHDIHHLNANVPSYRLKDCHRALSPHFNSVRIGLIDGLRCIRWKLWDEETRRMVPFPPLRAELRGLPPAQVPAE